MSVIWLRRIEDLVVSEALAQFQDDFSLYNYQLWKKLHKWNLSLGKRTQFNTKYIMLTFATVFIS